MSVRTGHTPDMALADAQLALWLLQQRRTESTLLHIGGAGHVLGHLDAAHLEAAWRDVTQRHPALRTVFPVIDDQPRQRVLSAATGSFTHRYIDDPQAAQAAIASAAATPFDVTAGPLARLVLIEHASGSQWLALTAHHLVADLWSIELILADLSERYLAHQSGVATPLPPGDSYNDIISERESRWAKRSAALITYWRDRLKNTDPSFSLPQPTTAAPASRTQSASFTLDPQTTQRLQALAEQSGVTMSAVLLAALNMLLFRCTGRPEHCIAMPVHGRDRALSASTVGLFVNTLLVNITSAPRDTTRTMMRTCGEQLTASLKHASIPFHELVQALGARTEDPRHVPYAPILLTLQVSSKDRARGAVGFAVNDPSAFIVLGDALLRPEPLPDLDLQFPLHLDVAVLEQLIGSIRFDPQLVDATFGEQLGTLLTSLLTAMAESPDVPLRDLAFAAPIAPPGLSGPHRSSTPVSIVLDEITRRAQTGAREQIITIDDPTTTSGLGPSSINVTAEELLQRARQWGATLQGHDIRGGDVVALLLPRAEHLVPAMLGCWLAGAAYLPMDPDLPMARLQYMMKDSGARVVVTDGHPNPSPDLPQITPADLLDGSGVQPAALNDQSPAYVLYTSGSTGKPKGVVVPHRALSNFLLGMADLLHPGRGERVLAVTTISFDISALELFLPCITGGVAHLVSREVATDGHRLRSRCDSGRYHLLQATPSTWELLLEAGWQAPHPMTLACGGEALRPTLANRLAALGSAWNLYGPTETTVWSTAAQLPNHVDTVTPIGAPIRNTDIYIVDEHLNAVPAGVIGELVIAGEGLALGYLNRPSQTAAVFRPNPFSDEPGSRLYCTGDLATWDGSGQVRILGRRDGQIKVRGHRIEIGEIEHHLASHPDVKEAVVTLSGGRLMAHLKPSGVTGHPRDADLREHLAAQLPSYMHPAQYRWVDAFPLTASGKIDRRELSSIILANGDPGPAQPPSTTSERLLAEIISSVLQLPGPVDTSVSLLDLGASSLDIARIMLRIRSRAHVDLDVQRAFEAPTISALARHIDQATAHTTTDDGASETEPKPSEGSTPDRVTLALRRANQLRKGHTP